MGNSHVVVIVAISFTTEMIKLLLLATIWLIWGNNTWNTIWVAAQLAVCHIIFLLSSPEVPIIGVVPRHALVWCGIFVLVWLTCLICRFLSRFPPSPCFTHFRWIIYRKQVSQWPGKSLNPCELGSPQSYLDEISYDSLAGLYVVYKYIYVMKPNKSGDYMMRY